MALSKIDSNVVYTLVAPEQSIGVFPVGATWKKLDLSSYSDAGSSYETATRNVMSGDRRGRKGKQSSKTVNFGYNAELTSAGMLQQIASFLYGVPNEKFTSRSEFFGTSLTTLPNLGVTAVSDTSITLSAAPAANSLAAGDIIVLLDGKNDRVPLVVKSIAAAVITVEKLDATNKIRTGTIPAKSRVVKVGIKAAADDFVLGLSADSTRATLTTTARDFTTMGLKVGEWVFVGGDAPANKFGSTAPFYARIVDVAAKVLTFDTTTSPIVADTGAGKAITLYFGTFITDGSTRTSFTHARYLGKAENGDALVETFTGCVPNEMSINASEAEFVTLDLAYLGLDHKPQQITQEAFNATYANVVQPDEDAEAYHTATDIYRQRLAVDKLGLSTSAITSFVQDSSLSVTNNISGDTGNGKLGAFDFSVGDFGLSGSLTAYFIGLEAVNAIRCNCTVGMDLIFAAKNTGAVVDVPAFTLGGGIEVEANASIKIGLEQAAFKSRFGYVVSYTSFAYLPNIAMPEGTGDCEC